MCSLGIRCRMQDCSSAVVTHDWQSTEKPSYCVFAYSYSKAHKPHADTLRCSSASGGMFGSLFLFCMHFFWKSELVFAGGLHRCIGAYACLHAWMRDWGWCRMWLSNETPLKSVTWGEGCYTRGEKTKQDKKRTSEKLIWLSNQHEANKSARQPQLRRLATVSWLTVSLVPPFDLLTLKL